MADKQINTQAASSEPPVAAQSAKGGGLLDLFLGGEAVSKQAGAQKGAEATGGASFLDMILGTPPPKKAKPKAAAATKSSSTGKEVIGADEVEAEKRYLAGLQKVLDIIAPSGMEVNFKHIKLGGNTLCRTFYVYNWPSQIHINWLSPLVNLEAKMDISQFIYPASSQAVMKMLKRKVTEMRASMRMRQEKGFGRDPTLQAALEDAELLRDMLARGYEKFFQFGLYITVYADSEQKLKETQVQIESMLGGKLVLTRPADFQMEHAWNSTLPFCLDEIEVNRNMNTSPLSTSFPFSSSDLTSDRGILYGINRHNDSLIIFDRFSLPNANSTVFASSGAGKSYAVKLEVIRYLMMETDVFIIDPENEYTELAQVVGGAVIPLSTQSSYRINPFDLPKSLRSKDEEEQPGELLRSAVINLHGLLKLMFKTVSPEQEGILDKAILDTYALKGITFDTPDPGEKEPPTLHDLVSVLQTTEGGEDMARILTKFTDGSFAGLFNQPTNIDVASQLMVFQTRDLEEALRPMAIYIVLNFLWNEVRSSLKRRIIVIDEAWNVMQYEDSARFLYGLIKRARKYYLGITTITQDVEDFMNSPYGKPIVTNAAMQILLKQAPSAIKSLKEAFDLTDGERYLLLNAGVGQGVFFAGRKHVALQIIASPKEHEIVTTNPEEISKKNAEQAATKGHPEQSRGVTTNPEEISKKNAEQAAAKGHPEPFDGTQDRLHRGVTTNPEEVSKHEIEEEAKKAQETVPGGGSQHDDGTNVTATAVSPDNAPASPEM